MMRWQKPSLMSKRTIRRYLLWPKAIDGETRWLEWAYIEQMYTHFGWRDNRWADWVEKRREGTG